MADLSGFKGGMFALIAGAGLALASAPESRAQSLDQVLERCERSTTTIGQAFDCGCLKTEYEAGRINGSAEKSFAVAQCVSREKISKLGYCEGLFQMQMGVAPPKQGTPTQEAFCGCYTDEYYKEMSAKPTIYAPDIKGIHARVGKICLRKFFG